MAYRMDYLSRTANNVGRAFVTLGGQLIAWSLKPDRARKRIYNSLAAALLAAIIVLVLVLGAKYLFRKPPTVFVVHDGMFDIKP